MLCLQVNEVNYRTPRGQHLASLGVSIWVSPRFIQRVAKEFSPGDSPGVIPGVSPGFILGVSQRV